MEPKILPLLIQSKHQLDLCVSLILLWIAYSDGDIDHSEREFIFGHMISVDHDTYDSLVSIIVSEDIESFLLVCKAVQSELDAQLKESLLVLAISVAIIDMRLAISENHILRFLADLMGYSSARFNLLYQSITGGDLPDAGDPSSMAWWKSKSAGPKEKSRERQQGRPQPSGAMSREEAHVILGVSHNATPEDIRRAYKRLMQAHHPDKFSGLGGEAEEIAHAMFVRIQAAYKLLMP